MFMQLNSSPIRDDRDSEAPNVSFENVKNETIRKSSAAKSSFINAPERMNTEGRGETRGLAIFNTGFACDVLRVRRY